MRDYAACGSSMYVYQFPLSLIYEKSLIFVFHLTRFNPIIKMISLSSQICSIYEPDFINVQLRMTFILRSIHADLHSKEYKKVAKIASISCNSITSNC